jgi:hypothetical protein
MPTVFSVLMASEQRITMSSTNLDQGNFNKGCRRRVREVELLMEEGSISMHIFWSRYLGDARLVLQGLPSRVRLIAGPAIRAPQQDRATSVSEQRYILLIDRYPYAGRQAGLRKVYRCVAAYV